MGILTEVDHRDPGTSSAVLTRLTWTTAAGLSRHAQIKRRTNLLTNRPATSGHRQQRAFRLDVSSGMCGTSAAAKNQCGRN